jgi:uncharacterized NAD(P)/FAD-binding protein YdhS
MPRIAVIGGGAAGAAATGEFLRHGNAGLELVWLTGGNAPGRGVAYATDDGLHLLNVRAANMGLFVDDTGGLVRYLESRRLPYRPGDFVPRALFGDYAEDTLSQLLADRRSGVCVDVRDAEAFAIVPLAAGGYVVHTSDGTVRVDGIVLAVGALPPVPIAEVHFEALDSGCYAPDAWRIPPLDATPRRIVVLGSGLTAVDVILSAAARWPDAEILALSRHGCLPAAHTVEPPAPYPHQAELIELLRDEPSIRGRVHLLREALREYSGDWRAIVDGLRPVTVELWRSLDPAERRRFLRHTRWAWEAVRHRMPPQTMRAIETLRAEGRLLIAAGRIRRIDGHGPLTLSWRRRADGSLQTTAADLAIQATGLQTAVKRTPHRLLRQMLVAGLVRVDGQGLGIEADVHGRVRRADGAAAPGLRVIGSLLRGAIWECTALPEIRMMAARFARELPAELAQTARDTAAAYRNGDSPVRQAGGGN